MFNTTTKQHMGSPQPPPQDICIEVDEDTQQALALLADHWGMATTTAALELLISVELDRSVFNMTGMRPGPKLAIDNTTQKKDVWPWPNKWMQAQ